MLAVQKLLTIEGLHVSACQTFRWALAETHRWLHRMVWRYVINAVIVSLGKKPWSPGVGTNRAWHQKMQRYMQLYRQRQEAVQLGQASFAVYFTTESNTSCCNLLWHLFILPSIYILEMELFEPF